VAGVIVCCQYARHNYARLSLWDKGLFPLSLSLISRSLSLASNLPRCPCVLVAPNSSECLCHDPCHKTYIIPSPLPPPSFYCLPVIIASPSVSLSSSLFEHVRAWATRIILSLTLFCLQTIKTTKMQMRTWVLNAGEEKLGMYKTAHCLNQRVWELPEWLLD